MQVYVATLNVVPAAQSVLLQKPFVCSVSPVSQVRQFHELDPLQVLQKEWQGRHLPLSR